MKAALFPNVRRIRHLSEGLLLVCKQDRSIFKCCGSRLSGDWWMMSPIKHNIKMRLWISCNPFLFHLIQKLIFNYYPSPKMMKYSQVNSEQKYLKIFLEYSDLNSSWDYSPSLRALGSLPDAVSAGRGQITSSPDTLASRLPGCIFTSLC